MEKITRVGKPILDLVTGKQYFELSRGVMSMQNTTGDTAAQAIAVTFAGAFDCVRAPLKLVRDICHFAAAKANVKSK